MITKKTIHPHDKFFKDAFSRISAARSFIEQYLPQDDKALIDIASLEAVQDSHVNPKLQELFSDVVYAGLTPDEMIGGIAHLRILFLTLKHIKKSDLTEKIEDIIVIFKELNDDLDASEYFEALMKYLEGATKSQV